MTPIVNNLLAILAILAILMAPFIIIDLGYLVSMRSFSLKGIYEGDGFWILAVLYWTACTIIGILALITDTED